MLNKVLQFSIESDKTVTWFSTPGANKTAYIVLLTCFGVNPLLDGIVGGRNDCSLSRWILGKDFLTREVILEIALRICEVQSESEGN